MLKHHPGSLAVGREQKGIMARLHDEAPGFSFLCLLRSIGNTITIAWLFLTVLLYIDTCTLYTKMVIIFCLEEKAALQPPGICTWDLLERTLPAELHPSSSASNLKPRVSTSFSPRSDCPILPPRLRRGNGLFSIPGKKMVAFK